MNTHTRAAFIFRAFAIFANTIAIAAAQESGSRSERLTAPWEGDPPRNALEWAPQRAKLLAAWTRFLGQFPDHKAPLAARFVSEPESFPGYSRRRVAYSIEPGVEMDAVLFLPSVQPANPPPAAPRKVPGIVVFHPTLKAHYAQVAGFDKSDPEKMMGPQLASRGFAVLCPRCFIFDDTGDYAATTASAIRPHPGWRGMTRMTWDGIRAIDYLASLPEVDENRIGIIGHSLGAKEVLYVAAFDSRVRATVFSEGGIGLHMSNWNDVWYLGGSIREANFNLDHHQLLALIAPRPFLLLAGGGPNGADSSESKRYTDAVAPLYKALGAPDALRFHLHGSGHRYSPEARAIAEEFLLHYLSR